MSAAGDGWEKPTVESMILSWRYEAIRLEADADALTKELGSGVIRWFHFLMPWKLPGLLRVQDMRWEASNCRQELRRLEAVKEFVEQSVAKK